MSLYYLYKKKNWLKNYQQITVEYHKLKIQQTEASFHVIDIGIQITSEV